MMAHKSNPLMVLAMLAILGGIVVIAGNLTGKLEDMVRSVGWWPKL